MHDRLEKILKIICLVLVVLVVAQLIRAGFRFNPLAGVTIPAVPTLPAETNAVADATNNLPRMAGTNIGKAMANSGTNPVRAASVESNSATPLVGSNAIATVGTATEETNAAAPKPKKKVVVASASTNATETAALNIGDEISAGTNAMMVKQLTGTNLPAGTNALAEAGTNGAAKPRGRRPAGAGGPGAMMMAGMGGPGGMKKLPDLPPAIQARINRVVESEILGPIPHPMPMALLGIAGNYAFLRAASGQTGMVKEGDSVGELKLVRIGINRVLVEQDGQPKELMIFSGYGGETLLPKNESSNETTKN